MNIAESNKPATENINRIICKKGLKQKHIAMKAGYTPVAFNSMLKDRKIIRISDLIVIAKAMNIPVADLLMEGKEEHENRK